MSEARERVAEAWHQFLLTAVSEGAEPHEVFAWAYMAGWAHDKWPAVLDIVPPPDVTRRPLITGDHPGGTVRPMRSMSSTASLPKRQEED